MAVGRRAAHLVSYWIARKVNDPKYVGILSKTRIDQWFQYCGLKGVFCGSAKAFARL